MKRNVVVFLVGMVMGNTFLNPLIHLTYIILIPIAYEIGRHAH